MTPTPLSDIARWTNSELVGASPGLEVSGVCTDSRLTKQGDLFFALLGENSDGHKYVDNALKSGVTAAVVSTSWYTQTRPNQGTYLISPDPLAVLGKWAQVWRKNFDIPVLGLTGSAGKTTTREMISAALGTRFPVLTSQANYNTEIGVPITLLDLTTEHHAAVIEMAMRGSGQISYLCQIALPSCAVITNIGHSHLELLGSRDNIAYAKAELLELLPAGAWSVLPEDDDYFEFLRERAPGPVVTFGLSEDADYKAQNVQIGPDGCPSFDLAGAGQMVRVRLQVPGRFHVLNACAAAAAAARFGVSIAAIAKSVSEYRGFDKRSRLIDAPGGWKIYDDTYNASPVAAAGTVEALGQMQVQGRRIAVLGDMKELGEIETRAHNEVGEAVAANPPDLLVTVGEVSRLIYKAAAGSGYSNAHEHLESASAAADFLSGYLRSGDVILVKGSRALSMEVIVERLMV